MLMLYVLQSCIVLLDISQDNAFHFFQLLFTRNEKWNINFSDIFTLFAMSVKVSHRWVNMLECGRRGSYLKTAAAATNGDVHPSPGSPARALNSP